MTTASHSMTWATHAPYIADLIAQHAGRSREAQGWQVLKVAEEAGEVAAAWIGHVGQNPRKGVTHSIDDVIDELADVVATAYVAMATLGRDPEEVMAAHMARMIASGRVAVYEEVARRAARIEPAA